MPPKLEMSHEDLPTLPSRPQSAMFRVMRNTPEGDGTGAGAEGAGGTPPATPPAAPTTLEDAQRELNRIRDALHKANKEAETNRKRLADIEAKEKAAKDAQLTEAERAKQEALEAKGKLSAATAALNAERVSRQVERAAAELKFINVEDATRFLDMSKITIDDGGVVLGVKEQLTELAKNRPYLLKQGGVSAGTPRPLNSQQFGTPASPPANNGLPRKLTGL